MDVFVKYKLYYIYIQIFTAEAIVSLTKTNQHNMSDSFQKLQVNSSGQYLNIFQETSEEGRYACQGLDPTTKNFYWDMIQSPDNPGWYLLKVKYSGQYLNVLNNSTSAGATTGQNSLSSINNAPANFLWQMKEVASKPGWFLLLSKSSGQYLMIKEGGTNNGAVAVQDIIDNLDTPPTKALWQLVIKDSKPVKVNLQIDCSMVYPLAEGALTDAEADGYLDFSDDNNGRKETGHQSSFESLANPGSIFNWKATTKSGQKDDYKVSVDSIEYDPNTGTGDVFPSGITKNNGELNAQVSWTAIGPETGDNEYYTVNFTIEPKKGPFKDQPKSFSVDPRIKILAKPEE